MSDTASDAFTAQFIAEMHAAAARTRAERAAFADVSDEGLVLRDADLGSQIRALSAERCRIWAEQTRRRISGAQIPRDAGDRDRDEYLEELDMSPSDFDDWQNHGSAR